MQTPPTLARETKAFFPASYADARRDFLDAVQTAGQVLSLPLDDEQSTETAWFGPRNAGCVLVLISGTHGVEGPVGTAIQLDWLARQEPIPHGCAILLIFALNPFGYAHHRRCDGEGIDLNRNFVNFALPLPENPGYVELMDAIRLPSDERRKQFQTYRRQHGTEAFEIAISGGQYTDPDGPFHGGKAPGHGNRATEDIIDRFELAGRKLAVVDIHSGLGPYGHGEVICDHLPGTAGFHAAMDWYGAAATAPAEGTSSSVRKAGLLDYRWHALMEKYGCFVTLEYGSYPIDRLFDTVLDDHRAWASGDAEAIRQSGVAMREHFCPADGCWRELVLVKGRQVIRQALEGLVRG